jgi:outer membrane receptor protein involved in Fe transport
MQSGKTVLYVLFTALWLLSIPVSAQKTAVISGYVKSESGAAIPGATVAVKNTSRGTACDANGFYSFPALRPGSYLLEISAIGYHPVSEKVTMKAHQALELNFSLKENQQDLQEVIVVGKTENQQVKEQAFAVNAIETKQFANTTADLNQVLNRSTGVRIREQGGLGSNFNFSINGLSGKAVKYFIDGVPLELLGSAVSLNNIPVNLAERIEVYKGVVPVQLGSDAMGGAVNVITNQNQRNYLDLSHSYGSFNTHRSALSGQYVHKPTGITIKASGFYNYSDNTYKMKGVEILEGGKRNGNEITDLTGASFVVTDVRRFHDNYQSAMGQVEVGVSNKSWADVLYAGFGYSEGRQDLQTGFEQAIVYGNVARKSKASNATLRYKKSNLFLKGLDISLFAAQSKDTYITADTLFRQYYWDGAWTAKGASEMGSIRSVSHIIRPRRFVRANLSYVLNGQHSFNINYTLDHLRNENFNALQVSGDNMPGLMNKQILGFAYQHEFLDKRLTNTFFAKYYGLELERKKWIDPSYQTLRTQFNKYGFGIASRFKVLVDLGIKLSLERAYRLQEVEEVFGDGLNIQPNPDLKPESSYNANLGGYYGLRVSKHRVFCGSLRFLPRCAGFYLPRARPAFKGVKKREQVECAGYRL